MKQQHYRTKSFIYCAKALAKILKQTPGTFISPAQVKAAMYMEAFKEQKTEELQSDLGYVVNELQANPKESHQLVGGRFERRQSGGRKSKILGYRFIQNIEEPPQPDPFVASGAAVLFEIQKIKMEFTQALNRVRNLEKELEAISEEQRKLFQEETEKEDPDEK